MQEKHKRKIQDRLAKSIKRGADAKDSQGKSLRTRKEKQYIKEGILTPEEIASLKQPIQQRGESLIDAKTRTNQEVFEKKTSSNISKIWIRYNV